MTKFVFDKQNNSSILFCQIDLNHVKAIENFIFSERSLSWNISFLLKIIISLLFKVYNQSNSTTAIDLLNIEPTNSIDLNRNVDYTVFDDPDSDDYTAFDYPDYYDVSYTVADDPDYNDVNYTTTDDFDNRGVNYTTSDDLNHEDVDYTAFEGSFENKNDYCTGLSLLNGS